MSMSKVTVGGQSRHMVEELPWITVRTMFAMGYSYHSCLDHLLSTESLDMNLSIAENFQIVGCT